VFDPPSLGIVILYVLKLPAAIAFPTNVTERTMTISPVTSDRIFIFSPFLKSSLDLLDTSIMHILSKRMLNPCKVFTFKALFVHIQITTSLTVIFHYIRTWIQSNPYKIWM
jgi:hypothetical protein